MSSLTIRQSRFVDEYLQDGNGSRRGEGTLATASALRAR